MVGKEWALKNDQALEFTFRFLATGGLRYTPIDKELSELAGETVYIQEKAHESQADPYRRLDVRFAYRKNKPNTSWKLSLDIQNATNRINYKRPFYDAWLNEIHFEEQSGLVPVISYTLDF
jgi:outer membrane receptor protein involved in Fe transport